MCEPEGNNNNNKTELLDNDVECESITVINSVDDYSIPCKLWKPTRSASDKDKNIRGCVFFIHGGMFYQGDCDSHSDVSKALAGQLGLIVITATFRDASINSTTYKSGKTMQDLTSVARFVQSKYAELPFGIVGSSSGGYWTLALGNEIGHDGNVSFLLPLCPVADPHARAVYLQHCINVGSSNDKAGKALSQYHGVLHEPARAKEIFTNQLQFFESMDHMRVATKAIETNRHSIPTLMILGAIDKNVPPIVTQHVQNSWSNTKTITLGGCGHEIQNGPLSPEEGEEVPPYMNYIPDIDTFLNAVIGKSKTKESAEEDDAKPISKEEDTTTTKQKETSTTANNGSENNTTTTNDDDDPNPRQKKMAKVE